MQLERQQTTASTRLELSNMIEVAIRRRLVAPNGFVDFACSLVDLQHIYFSYLALV
jgi:hypothetical protein